MGVYLPNVDMPKDCMSCQFGVDGQCVAMNPARTRNWSAKETTNYCPLVELPPHGRLIDADALRNLCDEPHWCVWLSEIDDAPTILEAEEET